ncbi:MAG: hypothetical protein HZA89_10225 [Verrucomicrobia bacterium]|nr:hypothetical protein [Verrucomicrobiota bacterium]
MNQASVLRTCAQLGALNDTLIRFSGGWHSVAGRSLVPELARLIFPVSPRSQRRVLEVCADPDFVAPFIDFAIAGLMGLACRYCPRTGGQDLIKDLKRRENSTRILLQLQESTVPSEELLLALKTGQFEAVFPKLTRSILAAVSHQNDWVKDLGRLHLLTSITEISESFAARSNFKSVAGWFLQRMGISPEEYQALSHIFLAYAFNDLINSGSMFQDFLAVSAKKFDFFRLVITSPESVIAQAEPQTIEEALFGPLPLWVRPVLHDGKEFYISSRGWLFNKLLRGFPYLILETERARLGRDLTKDEVDGMRGEFGLIFEGYICWLFKQWFQGANVGIISPYYVKTAAGHWREKDFLLVHDGIGYPFEIKALVPPLGLRQTGDLDGWLKYFSHIADQSVEAAEALVTGRGFYADKSTKIQNVQKAYPCGVTFEATPFRQPIVLPFEAALSAKLGRNVFAESNGVGPLQLFDVETLESWDEFFSLPAETSQLFALLRQRAESVVHRYSSFGRMGRSPITSDASQGILERATERAKETILAKANEISAQVPLPEHLQAFGPQLRTVGGPWERHET